VTWGKEGGLDVTKLTACDCARKSRAPEPCGSCALFQLRREVFEAPRLNLSSGYSSRWDMERGLVAISCAFLCMAVQKIGHRGRKKEARRHGKQGSRAGSRPRKMQKEGEGLLQRWAADKRKNEHSWKLTGAEKKWPPPNSRANVESAKAQAV